MTSTKTLLRTGLGAAITLAFAMPASADMLGPVGPYLSFADSPFNGTSFSWFYLEDFEDHLLNTPGVSGSPGGVASVVFGPSIHDSVDADDGVIDGSGLNGDDWFAGDGGGGVTFTFDASALGGHLPTHAGIVWTDGGFGTTVTFTAFDSHGVLIGTATGSGFADNSNNGETAEDRFFGAIDSADGISSIHISSPGGGIEVDHLQYGYASAVPEPDAAAMLLAGLGVLALLSRASRRRTARPR